MESEVIEARKGAWTKEEDVLLTKCVQQYGQGRWHLVPQRAGLKRCRKSCRMRWLNYLSPNLKKGHFTEAEVDLILRMHKLLGNRWSLIAGRIPGRTANDIKNYWNTYIRRKEQPSSTYNKTTSTNIFKPQPHSFTISTLHFLNHHNIDVDLHNNNNNNNNTSSSSSALLFNQDANDDDGENFNHKHNHICSSSSPPLIMEEEEAADKDESIRWWTNLLQISDNINAVQGNPYI